MHVHASLWCEQETTRGLKVSVRNAEVKWRAQDESTVDCLPSHLNGVNRSGFWWAGVQGSPEEVMGRGQGQFTFPTSDGLSAHVSSGLSIFCSLSDTL